MQIDHVLTRAAASFGNNESRYFQALVQLDMSRSFKSMKRLIRLAIQAEDIVAQLGLTSGAPLDAELPSVDLVVQELRLGLEFKFRFREGDNEQGMTEALTFSFARKLCDEVWIVLDDEMSDADGARFRSLAANFTSGKVATIRMKDFADALKKRAGAGEV